MKPTRITYRRCRKKDLIPSVRLVMKSLNHLRKQNGMKPIRRRVREIPPFFAHAFSTDPKRFYCAWRGDEIVGFAGALRRGKQWFLSWLFVHPRLQDKGVGRRLIEKIWDTDRGVIHSVATMTYNPQAVGLYSSFGMVPESLMTAMSAEFEKLNVPVGSGLEVLEPQSQRDLAWIRRLEGEIRGFPRPEEWRYWLANEGVRILLFKRRGRPAGYAVVNRGGEIGPAGGTTHRNLMSVMGDTVLWCDEQPKWFKSKRVGLCCPHQNPELYSYLLSMGFRNVELLLFQSEQPYADHRRYVPASLAIF